ncbi:MAG: serine hydrolase [Bdellovibrionota bacterium]
MIESGTGWAGKLDDRPSHIVAWGRSKASPSLFYDLASLTKVVVTNSLILDLCVDLKKSIGEFRKLSLKDLLPSAPQGLLPLKISSIWDHRAGLKSHFLLDPLKSRQAFKGSREELWDFVLKQVAAEGISHGDETVYSDLDYWVLGAVLETYYKKNLSELWQLYKKKYALPSNDLILGSVAPEAAVPTESRHPSGVVNDDNAFFMQGIAPHAGLFSTAEALWDWMRLMQNFYDKNPEFKEYFIPVTETRFWCGWDRPSEAKTQAGEGASREEVLGHLGFTGTALWWNPLNKWGALLLTNRVHPSHSEESRQEIGDLRVKFFSMLWHVNREELFNAFEIDKVQ